MHNIALGNSNCNAKKLVYLHMGKMGKNCNGQPFYSSMMNQKKSFDNFAHWIAKLACIDYLKYVST